MASALAVKVGVKFKSEVEQVVKAAEKANFENLGHAAAAIRKATIASIRRGKGASRPGQPPHTRRGLLKRAILYHVDRTRQVAVIGPSHALAGASGAAHELGGKYKSQTFPKRPFMAPALRVEVNRFAGRWQGTIGG